MPSTSDASQPNQEDPNIEWFDAEIADLEKQLPRDISQAESADIKKKISQLRRERESLYHQYHDPDGEKRRLKLTGLRNILAGLEEGQRTAANKDWYDGPIRETRKAIENLQSDLDNLIDESTVV